MVKKKGVEDVWRCPKCIQGESKRNEMKTEDGRKETKAKKAEEKEPEAKRRRSNEEKKCYVCTAGIRAGANFLSCECGKICHKQARCSGRTRATQGDPLWRCSRCEPKPDEATHVMGRRIQDLKAQIEASVSSQKGIRTLCVECAAPTRVARLELRCNVCDGEAHKHIKCSRTARNELEALIRANSWTCSGCQIKNAPMQPAPRNEDNEGKEWKARAVTRKKIRIIQWNADDVRAKMPELQTRLREEAIDVCMVQETKLKEHMRTPKIQGYTSVRKDRSNGKKGGGLLTFVNEDIQFEEMNFGIGGRSSNLEVQGIRIRAKEVGAVHLINMYCPPFRRLGEINTGEEDPFKTEDIPQLTNAIYGGDLNAHSDVWDEYMTQDQRGEALEQWMMGNNMICLNDGTATRVNPGTGGLSCPDTTLVPAEWCGRMEWFAGDDLGSDHRPIYITMEVDARLMEEAIPRTTWCWKKANWEQYAKRVDELVGDIPEGATISERATGLAGAMIKAAQQHIGQATIRTKVVEWLTPEIKEAIKERNRLRTNISNNRQARVNQCRRIKEMTMEEKTKRWKAYLQDAEENTNPTKTWRIIKSLSGCPQSNGRNEVLKHKGKTYGTGKKKASIFMQHYAKVSRLKFNQEERALNRRMKMRIHAEQKSEKLGQESEDFSMEELKTAIHHMREKSAAGEDGVSPRLIKYLSVKALVYMLQIMNDSWRSGFSPQGWREGTIIPLLKAGKPASKIDSYRPVSLTSCVAKTMERMVANRLQFMAEVNGWGSEEQAGFRSGRCTEDQIIRISQDISDGFQKKPMERSVLALLDYSKAYDTVWRGKLLLSMLQKGVPVRYVNWIKGFLRNRLARVKVDNQLGKKYVLKEGLPQGAVLSPLLFLFFIDRLKTEMMKERLKVNISMYADDIAVWSKDNEKMEAENKVQRAVNIIKEWSDENKLTLNAAKSEASFFSTNAHEAKWEPSIRMDGIKIRFNPTPGFLGITFDRTLSFGAQTEKTVKAAKRRGNILTACAGQDWGWHKETLVKTYKSNIRSGMDYGAAGWHPWISTTNMEALERTQNAALRRVTGQMKTTPVDALRLETGVTTYKTHSERVIAQSYEKARRMPDDNPRARALRESVKHRSKIRSSWRERGQQLIQKCDGLFKGFKDAKVQKIQILGRPPWRWEEDKHWKARKWLQGGSTKKTAEETLKADAISTINAERKDAIIYTDGSATEGWRNGGSAAIVTTGPPENPTV